MKSKVTSKNEYKLVDIIRFLAALMIICIHSNRILNIEILDFFVKNVFCRIAVPIFFVSSAYLIREKSHTSQNYLKKKVFNLTKNYLFWSLIFLPFGFVWLNQTMTLDYRLYPVALIFGLLYSGTYYHLWYIPALIFSLLIATKILRYCSHKVLFVLAFLLFLFGSLETYYGFLPPSELKNVFDFFIQVFFTTRNGLFYGLVFTSLGVIIYDCRERFSLIKKKDLRRLLLGSLVLMIFEGVLIYQVRKFSLDCNYLVALVPFTFFLFLSVLSVDFKIQFSTLKIREISQYYYFVHPISVIFVTKIGEALNFPILKSGIISFLSIIVLTNYLTKILISMRKIDSKKFVSIIWVSSLMLSFIFICLIYYYNMNYRLHLSSDTIPCILTILTIIFLPQIKKWLATEKMKKVARLLID